MNKQIMIKALSIAMLCVQANSVSGMQQATARHESHEQVKISVHSSVEQVATITDFLTRVEAITAEYDPQDVCIFLDIDNTLIVPTGFVGSEEWGRHIVDQKIAEGYSLQEALALTRPSFWHTHHSITMRSVEDATSEVVCALQRKNFLVAPITARLYMLSELTLQQLRCAGLTFQSPIKEFAIALTHPIIYKGGVLFAGFHHDKGAAAAHFFEKTGRTPKVVVLLDDNLKFVEAMKTTMLAKEIPFFGFRYSYCDNKAALFDQARAAQESSDLQLLGNGKNS